MRIVSTELRQVFRAYTKQLRGEYERAGSTKGRESVAKGFERVDISPEAKALAQNAADAVFARNEPTDERGVNDDVDTDASEKDEKEKDLPKESDGTGRDIEVAN